jgi:hypothetical protein
VPTQLVELDDNEIKMLQVAIRQVQHTFSIAEAQSAAAGEPLTENYDNVREAYHRLLHKLEAVTGPVGPRLVK